MRALSIGATGMMAQQLNVETISNNIANMSTTGYKRERAEFQDLLYQQERRVGSPTTAQPHRPPPTCVGSPAPAAPTAAPQASSSDSVQSPCKSWQHPTRRPGPYPSGNP
jgi:flagellar hook-basal body protein